MERIFIIPQYLLYYVEKRMLYHFSKSIKSFKSFFNYMYWILKLYTNIHCEKFNVPLSFNNDISWKFLKIMTFFMCFTLLIKSKFTIDNLIRGMDRGGSLRDRLLFTLLIKNRSLKVPVRYACKNSIQIFHDKLLFFDWCAIRSRFSTDVKNYVRRTF